MADLPPYVEAREHLPVRAWVRGFQIDAVGRGWRGDRVYLTWRTATGTTSDGHRRATSSGAT